METKKKTEKKADSKTNKKNVSEVNYTEILTKIFYTLIVIAVISAANLFVNIIKNGQVAETKESTETEETGEYDVSMFNEKTTTETIESINKGNTEIIYIGRSTCGYCVKFLPILQEAQNKFGYTTTYIDLTEMTSDDQANLIALDNEEGYISENFGYTPMVLIFKDGKLVNGWVGYAEYDTFASFLNENGIK